MLFTLPDGNTAEAVRDALTATVQRLPDHLWQSLTWDQGREMAQHVQFSVDTGIDVYFCTPRVHGRGAPTRTPTDYSANTSPKVPT
jgi:transposase, IS30 family